MLLPRAAVLAKRCQDGPPTILRIRSSVRGHPGCFARRQLVTAAQPGSQLIESRRMSRADGWTIQRVRTAFPGVGSCETPWLVLRCRHPLLLGFPPPLVRPKAVRSCSRPGNLQSAIKLSRIFSVGRPRVCGFLGESEEERSQRVRRRVARRANANRRQQYTSAAPRGPAMQGTQVATFTRFPWA